MVGPHRLLGALTGALHKVVPRRKPPHDAPAPAVKATSRRGPKRKPVGPG